MDLYDDQISSKGKIFLVGKSFNHKDKIYESVTVVIENVIRDLYFVPIDISTDK